MPHNPNSVSGDEELVVSVTPTLDEIEVRLAAATEALLGHWELSADTAPQSLIQLAAQVCVVEFLSAELAGKEPEKTLGLQAREECAEAGIEFLHYLSP